MRRSHFLLSHGTMERKFYRLNCSISSVRYPTYRLKMPARSASETSSARDPDLHLLHHPVAMGLDRAFGRAQCVGDLLVGLAANDELEHFPLARRQRRDMGTDDVELVFSGRAPPGDAPSPARCAKKLLRRYGLGQEILRARLDGPHRGRDIGITGEKHDRQGRAEFAQASLKLRTAQSRYPHVEKNAARFTFVRQPIQQMLGRRISRDLVACFFKRRSIAVRKEASSSTICTRPGKSLLGCGRVAEKHRTKHRASIGRVPRDTSLVPRRS